MKIYTGLFLVFSIWSQNLAAQVTEAPTMVLAGSVDYQSQMGRVLGMLLLVLVLIFAVVWVMKKVGVAGHTSKGPLSIKACLPLSNKEKLYVIQVGEEQLLIGLSPNGISPLKTLETPIDNNDTQAIAMSGFSKKLHEMMLANKAPEPKNNIKETEIS